MRDSKELLKDLDAFVTHANAAGTKDPVRRDAKPVFLSCCFSCFEVEENAFAAAEAV